MSNDAVCCSTTGQALVDLQQVGGLFTVLAVQTKGNQERYRQEVDLARTHLQDVVGNDNSLERLQLLLGLVP